MSVDAKTIRLLIAAGHDVDAILAAATAMQRGDDARAVFDLIAVLERAELPEAQIGSGVYARVCEINERADAEQAYWSTPDAYTGTRDSNRARRGMSDVKWRALRIRIIERDGNQCRYCGSTDDLTCDHVLPLIRGGTNDESNLAAACRPCNSSKRDKLLTEWAGR